MINFTEKEKAQMIGSLREDKTFGFKNQILWEKKQDQNTKRLKKRIQ